MPYPTVIAFCGQTSTHCMQRVQSVGHMTVMLQDCGSSGSSSVTPKASCIIKSAGAQAWRQRQQARGSTPPGLPHNEWSMRIFAVRTDQYRPLSAGSLSRGRRKSAPVLHT